MSSWTFRTLPPALADTSTWRSVDVTALDAEEQDRFMRLYHALNTYLATGKLQTVCKEQGVDRHEVIRQLNRCVALAADGKPFGWTALLRHCRTVDYQRRRLPPKGKQGAGNATGAFHQLLAQYPDIRDKLEQLVFKQMKGAPVHQPCISAKSLHATFIALCERAGIGVGQYPFNSRSRGRRSVERFLEELLLQSPEQGITARYGTVARSHLNVGRGIRQLHVPSTLYDVVGLDPHKLHCIGSVRIPGPKGMRRVAIERLWIVPVLDDFSRAILGYSVAIRTECSAVTIEQAIISAMGSWTPRAPRVPTLRYRDGAGLPSGLFPELAGRAWCTLMVDNAATHYASAIAEGVRRRLGCFVNYGPVGRWEHRAALERVMKTLETYGFQQLPSSTGSHATDPHRGNAAKAAVQVGIDWEDLLDIIDIEIANYNATDHPTLGHCSPLDLIRDKWLTEEIDFLPRRLPPALGTVPELGVASETRIVRGRYEQGRRPYVEIEGVHYTSPLLSTAFALIGKAILVHIRESDMRTVKAYFPDGGELGILTAQGPWGQVLHTREMRKQINALRDTGQLRIGGDDNPVDVLLRYYASGAHKDAEKKPFKVSRSATRLVATMDRSGRTLAVPPASAPSAANEADMVPLPGAAPPVERRPLSRLIATPKWKSRLT
ncbi:MAG: hypothetical protein K2X55_13135 [Burkholderiaceae bacterium]|nr:hypothetical protein [Burkholderiaceae bacterium]